MGQIDVTATRCPDVHSIERISLGEKNFTETADKKTKHISQCKRCSEQLSEFKKLYSCIAEEIEKTISNYTLDMANSLFTNVHYGLIVCHPVSSKSGGPGETTKFHSSLKFSGNGKYNHQCRFSDFDFSLLQHGTFAIRVMADTTRNKLLLYLWSHTVRKFKGWRMKIPELHIDTQFSTFGECEISLQKIKDLDDKDIFIYRNLRSENKETCSEKIEHAFSD